MQEINYNVKVDRETKSSYLNGALKVMRGLGFLDGRCIYLPA